MVYFEFYWDFYNVERSVQLAAYGLYAALGSQLAAAAPISLGTGVSSLSLACAA